MEISKDNGLIGRITAPEIFGSDCRNIHRLKAKLHIQRVLARPATRADHSNNLLTNEYEKRFNGQLKFVPSKFANGINTVQVHIHVSTE